MRGHGKKALSLPSFSNTCFSYPINRLDPLTLPKGWNPTPLSTSVWIPRSFLPFDNFFYHFLFLLNCSINLCLDSLSFSLCSEPSQIWDTAPFSEFLWTSPTEGSCLCWKLGIKFQHKTMLIVNINHPCPKLHWSWPSQGTSQHSGSFDLNSLPLFCFLSHRLSVCLTLFFICSQ